MLTSSSRWSSGSTLEQESSTACELSLTAPIMFWTNMEFLGFDVERAVREMATDFSVKMFLRPNEKGALAVLHFLVCAAYPHLSVEFKHVYPPIDSKSKFKCTKIIGDGIGLLVNENLLKPGLWRSSITTQSGDHMYSIMQLISQAVLYKYMTRQYAEYFQEHKIPDIAVPRPPPSKMSLKHIIQRNLPVENEMLKLQSSRFAFQYKDQMDHLSHVHREYDSFAKELTSEYRKLQNTLSDLNSQIHALEESRQQTPSTSTPFHDNSQIQAVSREIVSSLQVLQRYFSMSDEDDFLFTQNHASADRGNIQEIRKYREFLHEVLRGNANKYTLDSSSLIFPAPLSSSALPPKPGVKENIALSAIVDRCIAVASEIQRELTRSAGEYPKSSSQGMLIPDLFDQVHESQILAEIQSSHADAVSRANIDMDLLAHDIRKSISRLRELIKEEESELVAAKKRYEKVHNSISRPLRTSAIDESLRSPDEDWSDASVLSRYSMPTLKTPHLERGGLNLTLAPKTPSVSSLRGVSLSAGSQSALKTPAPVRDAFSRMSLQWDDDELSPKNLALLGDDIQRQSLQPIDIPSVSNSISGGLFPAFESDASESASGEDQDDIEEEFIDKHDENNSEHDLPSFIHRAAWVEDKNESSDHRSQSVRDVLQNHPSRVSIDARMESVRSSSRSSSALLRLAEEIADHLTIDEMELERAPTSSTGGNTTSESSAALQQSNDPQRDRLPRTAADSASLHSFDYALQALRAEDEAFAARSLIPRTPLLSLQSMQTSSVIRTSIAAVEALSEKKDVSSRPRVSLAAGRATPVRSVAQESMSSGIANGHSLSNDFASPPRAIFDASTRRSEGVYQSLDKIVQENDLLHRDDDDFVIRTRLDFGDDFESTPSPKPDKNDMEMNMTSPYRRVALSSFTSTPVGGKGFEKSTRSPPSNASSSSIPEENLFRRLSHSSLERTSPSFFLDHDGLSEAELALLEDEDNLVSESPLMNFEPGLNSQLQEKYSISLSPLIMEEIDNDGVFGESVQNSTSENELGSGNHILFPLRKHHGNFELE